MQMSDHEILYHYNHAADQAAQVKILAELNAVDVATMRNKLLDLGAQNVPRGSSGVPKRKDSVTFDEKRAWELYNEGLCDPDIAKELGVCRKTVADWRKKTGLNIHRKLPEAKQVQPEPETDEQLGPAASLAPEEPAYMGVGGLLRVTRQVQEAFPQAGITADGHRVRDIYVHVNYSADGEVVSAEMELILEE